MINFKIFGTNKQTNEVELIPYNGSLKNAHQFCLLLMESGNWNSIHVSTFYFEEID